MGTNPWKRLNKLFVEEHPPDFEIMRAIEIGMTFLLHKVGKEGQQLYKPFQGTMWTVFQVCTYLGQKIDLNLHNYLIALSLSDSMELKVVKLHLYTLYNQPHFKDTLIEESKPWRKQRRPRSVKMMKTETSTTRCKNSDKNI